MELNDLWERRILDYGTDFVCFTDITPLAETSTGGFRCAVLFGRALSKEYIAALRASLPPKTREMQNTERKMDLLADKVAAELNAAGYNSVARLKAGQLPHKTVALRAGLGFIGKNNLLVTRRYGCAVILGKVLTDAPFEAVYTAPATPECGDCDICVSSCPTGALLGTSWTETTTREEIMTRRQCTLCLNCLARCPYTGRYLSDDN